MSYEYSELETRAILGAADISYDPAFLSFLTRQIRNNRLSEQFDGIIAYLARLANIRAFYPQALKVLEEIVLKEPKKFKNYLEVTEKICSKYPNTQIWENLQKRTLKFIQLLALKRKYLSEILANLNICTHFSRQWHVESLKTLSKYCPQYALGLKEMFKSRLLQIAEKYKTTDERNQLKEIAREVQVYLPEL